MALVSHPSGLVAEMSPKEIAELLKALESNEELHVEVQPENDRQSPDGPEEHATSDE